MLVMTTEQIRLGNTCVVMAIWQTLNFSGLFVRMILFSRIQFPQNSCLHFRSSSEVRVAAPAPSTTIFVIVNSATRSMVRMPVMKTRSLSWRQINENIVRILMQENRGSIGGRIGSISSIKMQR